MQITHEEVENGVVIVTVPGPTLDAGSAKGFKSGMAPVLASATGLLLDMREIQFMDSSGLGAILSCMKQMSAKGGEMKVFGLSRAVRALFELVRMHKMVEVYNTREEALATLGE